MRVRVSYMLDAKDLADAQQIADGLNEVLSEGVGVVSHDVAVEDKPFTVVGSIKNKPDQHWTEHVLADSPKEAAVVAAGKPGLQRTVTGVFPGHIQEAKWRV